MAGNIMAISLKNLGNGQLGTGSTDIVAAVASSKSVLVEDITFVNTDVSAITINVYYQKSGGTARLISPKDNSIAAAGLFVIDREITMATGDKIYGTASTGSKIDFVANGAELSS
jgi:hypothetical protein